MEDKKTIVPYLYVDLDSLLDTRVPILKELFPKFSTDYLEDPENLYLKRIGNNFSYKGYTIPSSLFETLYKYRTKIVLKDAKPTPLCYSLPLMLDDVLKNHHIEDKNVNPGVLLNIYPYVLDKEEIACLRVFLMNFIPNLIPVEIIYKSPLDLTPEYINRQQVVDLYMYNGFSWVTFIASTFSYFKHPLLDKTLFLPKQFPDISLYDKNKKDLYEILQMNYSYIVPLEFLEMSAYSEKNIDDLVEKEYRD